MGTRRKIKASTDCMPGRQAGATKNLNVHDFDSSRTSEHGRLRPALKDTGQERNNTKLNALGAVRLNSISG